MAFDVNDWAKGKYIKKVLVFDKVKDKELLEAIEKSKLSPTEYFRKLARKK